MKIWKQYNKRTKKYEWKARFEYNRKTFRLTESSQERLMNLVGEVRNQEKTVKENEKYNLDRPVVVYIPTLEDFFKKFSPTIKKHYRKVLFKRVSEDFLDLLPPLIKVNEVKKSHFQFYIDFRLGQISDQSNKPVKIQTVYKELYAITGALKKAHLYYDSLENWQVPQLPDLPKGFKKKTKRTRLVTDAELSAIVGELMKPPTGKQTHAHHFSRVRLAHQIEFGFWTGLRRLEICRLKFSQFDEGQNALLNVKRWKTDTVTKFFPLSRRAVEIIQIRREIQKDTDYIFTPDGEPIASSYRTLIKICDELGIPYGKFKDGGFILHDLRHNFGTEILQNSDIETARELLGHSNIAQTGTYVHTSADRLREAVRKRDRIDYDAELIEVFNAIREDKISEDAFVIKIKKLFDK